MDDAMWPLASRTRGGFCRFHRTRSVRGENGMNIRPEALPPSFMVFTVARISEQARRSDLR